MCLASPASFWLSALLALQVAALNGQNAAGTKTATSPAASLQRFVREQQLAGAVTLMATKDRVLNVGTIGSADLAAHRSMRPDSLFWIASMTKPMTAAALMMLVDEGRVELNDPVEKYLPQFKDEWVQVEQDSAHRLLKKPSHPITIRQILSHTSGLPFKSPLEQPSIDRVVLSNAVASYTTLALQFEPGSKYLYSNAGFNTAGRIIELLSHTSYAEFMQKRLFDPLGMKHTTFRPGSSQIRRLAKAYKPNEAKSGLEITHIDQLSLPLDDPKRQAVPAGGLFSTATDVARFCQMILNRGMVNGKRLLSEQAVQEMTSIQTRQLPEAYGLGWSIRRNAADGLSAGAFGHGGAYATQMWVDPAQNLALVLMVQHASFPDSVGAEINRAFLKAATAAAGAK